MDYEFSVISKKSLPNLRYKSFMLCLTPKVIYFSFHYCANDPF